MSRIGKKPIDLPTGVTVELTGSTIKVVGPLGQLQMDCNQHIKVKVDKSTGKVIVENEHPEQRQSKQMHGTVRALLFNMIAGVCKGFEKKMEIFGTGYGIKEKSGVIVLNVGFSRPVELAIPKGTKVNITVDATKGNDVPAKFTVASIDKYLLGQFAANIRRIRPPEPYKGKGIRYAD